VGQPVLDCCFGADVANVISGGADCRSALPLAITTVLRYVYGYEVLIMAGGCSVQLANLATGATRCDHRILYSVLVIAWRLYGEPYDIREQGSQTEENCCAPGLESALSGFLGR
jgi:hypothetical protein